MGIAAGFFFLLCSCLLSGIHGLHGNDDDDASALLALKAHMRDDAGCLRSWAVYPSGGIPSHCVWAGVSCDACGAVIALNLSGMNLSGTISGIHLGRLRRLVNLTLADNSFSGGLPSEISLIPGLRRVNISTNAFNGSFPSNFSALKELEILDCFNNNFSGPLPVELSRLTRLKWLHLGGNYFDGTIPPQYGNLQNLEYLGLNGNSLTGKIPPQLGSLTQLQELYLGYYNTFDGGIPWEFGCLTNLYSLDMASCGLSSSLPASLGSLSKLNTLYLQINNFTGVIPSQFGNLTSLKSLDLSENYLTGSIPEELVNLQRIELLSLFLNNLQGQIPSFVAHWPHLQVLFLWGNNLTGNVPLNLGENRQLTKLDVSNNSLTGYIPPNLCLGGQLTALILQSNFFTGSIPPSLGKCSTLDRVRLGENRLTGSIPSSLFSLPVLSILETPHNSLTGSLPFNPLPLNLYLSRLDLSHNRLSGVIPSGFSKLIGLRTLLISDNRLTGEIPNGISHLKYLATLDLSHNLLNGSIPLGIGFCQSLTILNLSQNDLTGEIPSQIANLTVLDYFNVSRNSLSGNIPLSLQEMQSLTSPDFSFNNLSGRVPEQGQFSNLGVNIYEGNPGLCGGSEGMKLPACKNIIASQFPSSRFMSDRVRIETGYAVWFILAVISFATILLFIVRLLVKNGGGGGIKGETGDSRWKLTTYHKVEFEAEHVLGCLMEENIVGKGGAGVVYKGVMPSGEVVAVKRLPPIRGSNPSDYGFGAEIETLGKIRHRHIVRLLACCSSGEMNLLVYEYMPNGSLADWLHGHKPAMVLDWPVRYKVAIEAAKGLSYLHYDCSPPILHRDVKSSNILLDSEFEAHVSDFGLAKALGESEYVSSVAGSFGYIAPEYSYTLKVDEKSDIYSFGIVLLELLSGRRPTDPEYGGEGGDIARWVKERVRNKAGTLQFLDKRLVHGNDLDDMQDMEEMMIVLRVALLCIDESPLKRPTMRQVVQMLTKQS